LVRYEEGEMEKVIHVPRFQEALRAHSKSLSTGTYWRYLNGMLPAFGQFIVSRPELAEALAEDARALSAERPIVGQREAA
jgi:hypothetical protein